MRRKFWAIRELGSCIGGYWRLFLHAHVIWSVHTDARTRHERMADLHYQIDGTPLKYEQQKLERRLQRAALALLYPSNDRALLSVGRILLPLQDPKAKQLYDKLEELTLNKLIGDL